MTITVVLAEDQFMVLGALSTLLGLEADIAVAGTAADGEEAVRLVEALRPDVLLTDIEMPKMTGLEVAAEVRRRGLPTQVVILTTFARSGYLRRALDTGAVGYLLKDAPASALAQAIRDVHAGGRAIDPQLAADAWGEPDPLTDRERQVLRLAGDGLANGEIAGQLHLSEGTVRNYLSEAMSKLGASNRIAAPRQPRDRGWLRCSQVACRRPRAPRTHLERPTACSPTSPATPTECGLAPLSRTSSSVRPVCLAAGLSWNPYLALRRCPQTWSPAPSAPNRTTSQDHRRTPRIRT